MLWSIITFHCDAAALHCHQTLPPPAEGSGDETIAPYIVTGAQHAYGVNGLAIFYTVCMHVCLPVLFAVVVVWVFQCYSWKVYPLGKFPS